MSGKRHRRRVGALIQARLGSSRFPGKVLEDLAGAPMLQRLVDRLAAMDELDMVVVATSDRPGDDRLAAYCEAHRIPVFRGDEADVLGRFRAAAAAFGFDLIVRACGDAPLTDPDGIRALLRAFETGGTRFVHNRHPRGWPVGTAADLLTRDALEEAADAAGEPHQREHVTPYLDEHGGRFGRRLVEGPAEWGRPGHHLAVDYPEDLAWMRRAYAALDEGDLASVPVAHVLAWIARTGDAPRPFVWPEEAAALAP